jgi:hypothetical protein
MTESELKKEINKVLNDCDSTLFPYVCGWRSTEGGRAGIIEFVVQEISLTGESIQSALNMLERAYNPNLSND